MSASTYTGAGTTLSSSYYIRRFYSDHETARTATSRKSLSNATLSSADADALRRAIKNLRSFSYDDDNAANIRNNVSAFISTYNNLLDSASNSTDHRTAQNAKNLKNLTNEYADEFDKIGVTIKSDGTLEARSSLLSSADISRFEKLFSSDSDYMQHANAYAKRIETQSNALSLEEQQKARSKSVVALDLDLLLNNGIGGKINISL